MKQDSAKQLKALKKECLELIQKWRQKPPTVSCWGDLESPLTPEADELEKVLEKYNGKGKAAI